MKVGEYITMTAREHRSGRAFGLYVVFHTGGWWKRIRGHGAARTTEATHLEWMVLS